MIFYFTYLFHLIDVCHTYLVKVYIWCYLSSMSPVYSVWRFWCVSHNARQIYCWSSINEEIWTTHDFCFWFCEGKFTIRIAQFWQKLHRDITFMLHSVSFVVESPTYLSDWKSKSFFSATLKKNGLSVRDVSSST